MLWYLLYPLRGTTEAPVLAPSHPLRRLFTQYGTWVARHVKTVLPLSGAVVFIFLYLVPFLYTVDSANITNGASPLPHHVWTDARPLRDGSHVEPDVVMRSIWQRDAFHISNGLTNQSWFFHSPLQYWSSSAENIASDQDLISTVNEKKTQSTFVNTTLRHSIVFSGKRFQERQIVAADALVITLIHKLRSPVGRQWVKRLEALAQGAKQDSKWQIIPPDGRSIGNQLYQFQFQPMTWYDWAMLVPAYGIPIYYLLYRLSKLRAVKSRVGLMVTMLAQITASIVSSFTVCAIFKVDLSHVPLQTYPFVILAISMENSFRLINAVIMTSSAISISDRIGEAFGTTAHIAIASPIQNSLILYGLSKTGSLGVSSFCAFATIATFFDFFYLATFFLAVLSVDVRQRELCELEKASLKRAKTSQGGLPKQPWIRGIYPFRLTDTAISTRIAGSIVLIGFVLIAQAHYTSEGSHQWLNQLSGLSWRDAGSTPKSSLLIDIHQVRSATSWLRMQDHETAREVIKAIKPWAHSYVARVYDPVIFVLRGADRTPDTKDSTFLPAVYDFLHHQIPLFIASLLTMLAALRLRCHAGRITGGKLVSVGLDRAIQVWDVPTGSRNLVQSDPEAPLDSPFPVLNVALDDRSKWLALVSWQRVFIWNMAEKQWADVRDVDLGGHRPEAAFFVAKSPDAAPSLVLVRRNGIGLEVPMAAESPRDFLICKTPLVWAVSFTEKCAWEALPSGSIVGVHKKRTTPLPTINTPSSITSLRSRRTVGRSNSDNPQHTNTPPETHTQSRSWESWVLNLRPDAKSDFETHPLNDDADTSSPHLMISELGPMTRLGTMSVAVGLGDVVKVVSAGHEYFDHGRVGSLVEIAHWRGFSVEPGGASGCSYSSFMVLGRRRKKGSGAGLGRGGSGERRESANANANGNGNPG
ncbi:hypothetical protein CHGG_02554 [Chaetomium globosum CBS 148.51]|uniref:Sterol regulatory element-binding protein cleavage-activating protein n=1 Tax=Chaetomium globosum (strain ATCC 6205 / CBS 148.51 / DSM 1962 / NBRC 6347 / NRRL 1970) TaxID=306901 RepID=Q2HB50_CHAGB|nr:uncharacterized protein CHGG_02554 [Chaetomium globosum CBS 148.51]EAQ90619.1 hypothetical protein CHGG_02554 [Chaetomium globosum CBS 148.51]